MLNIIIPLFNGIDTLPMALNSLLSQTKNLFYVTIIQDYDKQDYSQIIQEYQNRGLHIKFIQNKENLGPGLTRQVGIDVSNNFQYLMFLDSDDMLYPKAVELLTKEAIRSNADIIQSSFIREQSDGSELLMESSRISGTWMHGKIYKRDYLIEKNIRFDPLIRINEDSYFNLVCLNCTENKYLMSNITYLWRHNKNSITRSEDKIIFTKKSLPQYIYSQIKGLLKIYEINGNIKRDVLTSTLINIYNSEMKLYTLDSLNRNMYKDYIKELANDSRFISEINNYEVQQNLAMNVKGGDFIDKDYFFFKMPFDIWLQKFINLEE